MESREKLLFEGSKSNFQSYYPGSSLDLSFTFTFIKLLTDSRKEDQSVFLFIEAYFLAFLITEEPNVISTGVWSEESLINPFTSLQVAEIPLPI